jgi:hypothetical protein
LEARASADRGRAAFLLAAASRFATRATGLDDTHARSIEPECRK